jgi:hypothetical protein
MLIIRHLTGPGAGTEDRPDPKLNRIVFGRRTTCDVVFPPEETIIARDHFALVRKPPGPAGHWTIELFGEPFVAVNGIAAEPGQRLPADATIELGKHGGPSFTVHVEADASTDNLPLTGPQQEDEAVGLAAIKARRSASFARRIAFSGLAVAIVAGGVAVYWHSISPKPIGSAVRAQLLRAAFLVDVGRPYGTAFPIGPHTLATNSHVGKAFEELGPGQQMIVHSPGKDGKTYRVTAVRLHPGFDAFNAYLKQDVERTKNAQIGIPGYDVATLTVDEELPSDTILKLADNAELQTLNPGVELATAGYPTEDIAGGNVQVLGPTPEYHTGTVTGLTDFFFLPAEFAHSQLIHDSVPSAGGSSGSPIVDASGHVVALLSAGNMYFAPDSVRVPSGVLISYAQRVDLLRDLFDGHAETELTKDKKYWAQQYAVLTSGIDYVDKIISSNIQDANKGRPFSLVKVSQVTEELPAKTRIQTAAGKMQRQAGQSVAVESGTQYVFVGYAHDGSDLQIWAYDGDQVLFHAGGPEDKPSHTFAPWTIYSSKDDRKVTVWIVSPKDQDVTYTFQVLKIGARSALNMMPNMKQAAE